MENYYQILNVDKNATQKQIKQSYINLLKMYHPDVYTGDKEYAEKKTAEITMAYNVLRNYLQRKNYDEKLEKDSKYHQKQEEKKYPFTSANKTSEEYRQKQEKQKEQSFSKSQTKKDVKKQSLFARLFKRKKEQKQKVASPYKKHQPKKVEKVDINNKNVKIKKQSRKLTQEEQKEKQAFDLSIAVFVSILFLVIVLTIVFK